MQPATNIRIVAGLAMAVLYSVGSGAVMLTPDSSVLDVDGNEASFTGTVSAPANSSVVVNSTRGIVNAGRYYIDHVPVSPGSTELLLTLTTIEGETATAPVQVTAGARPSPVVITAKPSVGSAPIYATDFYLRNQTGSRVVQIEFTKSAGAPFKTLPSVTGRFTTSYPDDYRAPGVYRPTVRLTDDQGRVWLASTIVVVEDPVAVDTMLRALWADMNSALVAGDLARARKYLSGDAAVRYETVFQDLTAQLPGIVQAVSPLSKAEIANDYAEYSTVRRVNNVNKVFLVYFVRDGDGIWRIDSM